LIQVAVLHQNLFKRSLPFRLNDKATFPKMADDGHDDELVDYDEDEPEENVTAEKPADADSKEVKK